MENRKSQFKHKSSSVRDIRNASRAVNEELKKEKREKLVGAKRFKFLHDVHEEIGAEEVVETTKNLQKSGSERKNNLKLLQQAFSQGSFYIDAFFTVENSLSTLVGILTSEQSADLQLEAAWCITNIAAGTHEHAMAVAKSAAPYLITFIAGNNPYLQDQCAWAIGNLAADSQSCRELLHSQGVVQPLINLLQSHDPVVVQSSAFAISNLIREKCIITEEIYKTGILNHLIPHLTLQDDNRCTVSEISWVLTYLSSCQEYMEDIVNIGVLPKIRDLLIQLVKEPEQDGKILTPLLRCLGNICSGPDELTFQLMEDSEFFSAIKEVLISPHRHIVKESLWVISNMVGEDKFCEAVISSSMLTIIIEKLSMGFDIKIETLYVLCNLACHGEIACQSLVENGVLQRLLELLKSHDLEILSTSLALCEMCLRMNEHGRKKFEENHGIDRLEGLEYHNNNEIRKQAHNLLETYFYLDDEDGSVN